MLNIKKYVVKATMRSTQSSAVVQNLSLMLHKDVDNVSYLEEYRKTQSKD